MENKEDILDALNDFEKKTCTEIPPLLEQYLQQVAKSGKTWFPWIKLKKLFTTKVDLVMKQFKKDSPTDLLQPTPNVETVQYEDHRKRIMSLLEDFESAPFTIQRLCELIIEPKRHYQRCDKFLRGIEKNISVVSTVDPFGRKIVSESQAMVNGLDSNGFNETLTKPNPFSSFPTPTQSAWTASIDKWFGTSNTDQSNSSTDSQKEDNDSTEQKDGEEAGEMETSGTSSSDGDSNDEDVFTSNSVSSKEEEKSIEKSNDENQSNNATSQDDEETLSSGKENCDTTLSSEVNDQSKEQTDLKTKEQKDLQSHNTQKETTQKEDKQTGERQSTNALDMCNNAQNILDSVNRACSDAEEAFNIAQKVCDSEQEQTPTEASETKAEEPASTSLESSSEQVSESSSVQKSEISPGQSSGSSPEVSSVSSSDSSSATSSESLTASPSACSSAPSSENSTVTSSSENSSHQSSQNSDTLKEQSAVDSVQESTKQCSTETDKTQPVESSSQQYDDASPNKSDDSSECQAAKSVLSHSDIESSSPKKPRLQEPDPGDSEEMDVDLENSSNVNVAQCDSQEENRLKNVALVESSGDTPMEED